MRLMKYMYTYSGFLTRRTVLRLHKRLFKQRQVVLFISRAFQGILSWRFAICADKGTLYIYPGQMQGLIYFIFGRQIA